MSAPSPLARHGAADGVHRLAAGLLLGTIVATFVALVLLVAIADRPDSAAGDLLVIFPPGTSEGAVLGAAAASDGAVRRRGFLGTGWEVTATTPGFAGRLRRHGALLVLPGSPFPSLSLGGCSFLPPESYRRPDLAKLRAGPM